VSNEVTSTWATRELPILRAALRRLDEGADYAEIDLVRLETGIHPQQLRAGLRALATADPPYIEFREASGWKDDYAAGEINRVSERARREVGSWPSPESLVSELAAALAQAAEREEEPERKRRLTAAADAIGTFARDVAVGVFTQKLGQYVP
jgi:hypothetical protein